MMSLTFGLFTQVSGSGPLGPLVCQGNWKNDQETARFFEKKYKIKCQRSYVHS